MQSIVESDEPSLKKLKSKDIKANDKEHAMKESN